MKLTTRLTTRQISQALTCWIASCSLVACQTASLNDATSAATHRSLGGSGRQQTARDDQSELSLRSSRFLFSKIEAALFALKPWSHPDLLAPELEDPNNELKVADIWIKPEPNKAGKGRTLAAAGRNWLPLAERDRVYWSRWSLQLLSTTQAFLDDEAQRIELSKGPANVSGKAELSMVAKKMVVLYGYALQGRVEGMVYTLQDCYLELVKLQSLSQ